MTDVAPEEADQASTDLEKRIVEAFDVFDHGGSKTVDVREVGTILRALGCCPTEADIQEIIIQVEDQETSGSVQLERFLPVVSSLVQENKYPPASPEKLLKAFQTLDPKGQGFLTTEFLSKVLTEEGGGGGVEPFTKEELDEMLAVAMNNDTGTVIYEDFINLLMELPLESGASDQNMERTQEERSPPKMQPLEVTPRKKCKRGVVGMVDSAITKLQKLANTSSSNEEDEYDHFAKHVSSQLRTLPMRSYIKLQSKIQKLISEERMSLLPSPEMTPQIIYTEHEYSGQNSNESPSPAGSGGILEEAISVIYDFE